MPIKDDTDQKEKRMGIQFGEAVNLWDYFAAHAPEKPTFDFEVRMTENRPISKECVFEITRWDVEYYKQRAIQWPAVFADAMIAEREKRFGDKS